MKIKKPMTVKKPGAAPAAAEAPAGAPVATIADRFKLEPAAAPAANGGTVNKTAALVALIVAFAALAVSAVLTFVLYQHWQFLMPA